MVGSTLTTGIVLLPFLYLQGDARAAFVPFAAAFSLALAWSVVSAVLLVPALGQGHGVRQAHWPRAKRAYTRVVISLLRWRWATLTATVVVPTPFLAPATTTICNCAGSAHGSVLSTFDNRRNFSA